MIPYYFGSVKITVLSETFRRYQKPRIFSFWIGKFDRFRGWQN